MPAGPIEVTLEVAELLDRLGVPYALGGSLASSFFGEPRATVDVDLAIRLRAEDVPRLVEALGPDYTVSLEAALDAVRRHASFNAILLASVQKIDFFASVIPVRTGRDSPAHELAHSFDYGHQAPRNAYDLERECAACGE